MEKSEVISRVRTERNRWSEIMARIDDDLMLKPESRATGRRRTSSPTTPSTTTSTTPSPSGSC